MLQISLRLAAIVLIVQLTACGTTAKITNAWVDPSLQGKAFKGVLVIAITDKEASRIDFEDAYTKALLNEGAHAVASHTLFTLKADKDEVLEVARLAGLDTILVTRYAGKVDEAVFHRGTTYYDVVPTYGSSYRGRFGGYYGYSKAYSDPDVWTTNSYISLISDLYETSTEKPIWKSASIALDPKDHDELRDAFIDSFVKQMKEQQLLE